MQFLREGNLDEVDYVLSKAKGIVDPRRAAAKKAANAPQRRAVAGLTTHTPAAPRRPRQSRSKASRAARATQNGAVASGNDATQTRTDEVADPRIRSGASSLSMEQQERNVNEANAQ